MALLYLILSKLLEYYGYAIIIYILMSWFPGARETGIGRFMGAIVEPYLEPFRRIIPPIGMIDISPIVAIFLLSFAQMGLQALFFGFFI